MLGWKLCRRRLAFAEAGLAACFWLEDLLGCARAWVYAGERGLGGWEFLAFDDQLDLGGVQGLALQQGGCHAVHDVLVGLEDGVSRLVSGVDEGANLGVDLLGCVGGEVAGLPDLAAKEDVRL